MRAARILIIDDDALLQKSMALFLTIRVTRVRKKIEPDFGLRAFR